METVGNLAQLVLDELTWTIPTWLVTLLVGFILIRIVFGVSLKDVHHEIIEQHNSAFGGAFFVTSFVLAMLIGKSVGSAPQDIPLSESMVWLLIGFITAGIQAVIGGWLALTIFRSAADRPLTFFRREVVAEDNAALLWFIAGVVIVPFILTYHITV